MPKPARPNIVFVMTDQQRHDTIAALGHAHMITPNLDRMVEEGTAFSRMYVTSPSCAPSRASLFTGLFPHTNGVFRNDEAWPHTWVGKLADAGYRCVNVGKMHTSPFEEAFGFHERHVIENKDRATSRLPHFLDNWDKAIFAAGHKKPSRRTYREREDYADRLGAFEWELPEALHSDVFTTRLACEWLDTYPGREPFFLQIGIPGPHPPYDPPKEFIDLYESRDIPAPIRDAAAMEAQPSALKKLREAHIAVDHDAIVHLAEPDAEQLRRQRAHYCANVTLIDRQMGEILEALDRRGVLEDTIVIFTSDHGDALNDHGLSQKWSMYEGSVRVPAIVWAPGRVAAGRRADDLVSLFDFAPTILEMAGLDAPAYMEAQSLMPYLGSAPPVETRTMVFAEHAGDRILNGTQMMTMVCSGDWKLVHFFEGEGQLFDLSRDPDEIEDLWSSPDHAGIKAELIGEILDWRLRSSIKTQGWQRNA